MNKEINKKIGMYLKVKRLEKRFSQDELARICDTTQTTIGNVENGKSNLSLTNFIKMSTALEIPLDELLNLIPSIQINQSGNNENENVNGYVENINQNNLVEDLLKKLDLTFTNTNLLLEKLLKK